MFLKKDFNRKEVTPKIFSWIIFILIIFGSVISIASHLLFLKTSITYYFPVNSLEKIQFEKTNIKNCETVLIQILRLH